ncbi:MAG: hypothetical protein WAK55_17890, partial [Xanthobacteraceae bacterium]
LRISSTLSSLKLHKSCQKLQITHNHVGTRQSAFENQVKECKSLAERHGALSGSRFTSDGAARPGSKNIPLKKSGQGGPLRGSKKQKCSARMGMRSE